MTKRNTKWIIVTGGVLSGLGKGIVSSSIGALISGLKVVPVKCDGYLNIDPGTMNPIEHGEVFVLEDGGEVDMDFGHYERFLNINCKFEWNLTSGKVFKTVIDKERKGDYLGKTVQMIPHVTNEIKNRLLSISRKEKADIMIIEIGGTIGDIENQLFVEAVRQLSMDLGRKNFLFTHLTYVPKPSTVNEQKTKPTQQSVRDLQERGIQPDVIICRSEDEIEEKNKRKIALFANVEKNNVISNPDLDSVYKIPLVFKHEGLVKILKEKLDLKLKKDLKQWSKLINIKLEKTVRIAICGKYTDLEDSYVSIIESLNHASYHSEIKPEIIFLDTDSDITALLKNIDGIIVPGGFGKRGIEGKIRAINYARENNIPFLGLCFGLQLAVIEYARNVCGIKEATSHEFDESSQYKIIDYLEGQKTVSKGGTMRLGSYPCILKKGSLVHKIYGKTQIHERHRHRLEVNPAYHKVLENFGLVISGRSPDGSLAEFIELSQHKFFIATQAHPELKSRFLKPSPLFYNLLKACLK